QLGSEAVLVPQLGGGRHAEEQLTLVPSATVELRGRSLARDLEAPPWPGALPAPSPTLVMKERIPVEVQDEVGLPVTVTGRGLLSALPSLLALGRSTLAITAWAGPWPVDERWWDPDNHRRQARFQIVTDDGHARLLALEGGRWWITAVWD
ncbi:MAG: DNA polymerase Y family protein, partial [Actinomycetia bacterium]|nr:DNA polymerase Y family protein [Actinomycetes bacterium]